MAVHVQGWPLSKVCDHRQPAKKILRMSEIRNAHLRVGLLMRPTSQPIELQYEMMYRGAKARQTDGLQLSLKVKCTKNMCK